MDELIIEDLREAQVFALEAGALVIDSLDTSEELLIQEQGIVMGGEHGRRLFVDLLQLLGAVSTYEGREDRGSACEEATGLLIRKHGVLKGRGSRIARDAVDLGELDTDPLLDSGDEVRWADLTEVGSLVVKRALGEEGVLLGRAGLASSEHSEEAQSGNESFHRCVGELEVGGRWGSYTRGWGSPIQAMASSIVWI